MAHEYYFRHHLVEAHRNRFRLLLAVMTIVVGAVVFLVPSLLSVAATPSSKPVATSTPAPTPAATPKPVATKLPVAAPAASTAAPATPGNFQALVASDNALVMLSWAATSEVVGMSYKLERSFDRINWTVVASGLTASNFRDDTVAFGIHYYYRLSAVNLAGNASAFALADGVTAEFAANSQGVAQGNYMSDDQVASLDMPAGALNEPANCSVVAVSVHPRPGDFTLVAGPYALVCKNESGNLETELNKPVTWHVDLSTKLKGFADPRAVTVDTAGGTASIEGAAFDAKTQVLTFNQPTEGTVAVLAAVKRGTSLSVFAFPLVLGVLLAAGFIVVLRQSQKRNYNDYLRRKYYDV